MPRRRAEKVFISYRHVDPDQVLAQELGKALTGEGLCVFLDTGIEVGLRWVEEIERQLASPWRIARTICSQTGPKPAPASQVTF